MYTLDMVAAPAAIGTGDTTTTYSYYYCRSNAVRLHCV